MERFFQKSCDSTYYNFPNGKLCHGYFSANIIIFSEQLSSKPSSACAFKINLIFLIPINSVIRNE